MRVHVIVEVPDWKALKDVLAIANQIEPIVWQNVSGSVVGVVIEEKKQGSSG